MGMNTPFYPFLFHHVPGLSAFRRPPDGAFLLNLFLALLIGSSRMPERARLGPWPAPPIVATVLLVAFGYVLTLLALYAQRVGHGQDLLIVLRAFTWRLIIAVAIMLVLVSTDHRAMRFLAAPMVIGFTIVDLADAGRSGHLFAPEVRGSEKAQVYSGTLSLSTPRNPLEQSIAFLKQNDVAGPIRSTEWRR